MAYIVRSELRAFATSPPLVASARVQKKAARSEASTTVFLSHSHSDEDLVNATVNFLANQGVSVYVDWMDGGMPSVTSAATAQRIKRFIQLNRKFILLATVQSLASRWVPWELGCADGVKGLDHMAVMPVLEATYSELGNEYVDLYSTIHSMEGGGWGVVPPGSDRGVSLESWLTH